MKVKDRFVINLRFTEHFSCAEMACKCCGCCLMNPVLMHSLEKLRNLIRKPIHVLSGFRCYKHNLEVGGAKHSRHLCGDAADIVIDGMTVTEMRYAAEKIKFFYEGGIGTYQKQGFVHVDVRFYSARWDS